MTATATIFADLPPTDDTNETATVSASPSAWKTGDPVTCEIDYVQYVPKPLPTEPGMAIAYAHTETVTDSLACEGCALVVDLKTAGLKVRREKRTAVPAAVVAAVAKDEVEVTTTMTMPVTTVTTQACSHGEPVISVGAPNTMPLHTFEYSTRVGLLETEATATATATAVATVVNGKRRIWHDELPPRGSNRSLPGSVGYRKPPDYRENGNRHWHICDFFFNIC